MAGGVQIQIFRGESIEMASQSAVEGGANVKMTAMPKDKIYEQFVSNTYIAKRNGR